MGRIKPPVQGRRAESVRASADPRLTAESQSQQLSANPANQLSKELSAMPLPAIQNAANANPAIVIGNAKPAEGVFQPKNGNTGVVQAQQTTAQGSAQDIPIFRPQLITKPAPAPAAPPASNFVILNPGPSSSAGGAAGRNSEQLHASAAPDVSKRSAGVPSTRLSAGTLPPPAKMRRLRDSAAPSGDETRVESGLREETANGTEAAANSMERDSTNQHKGRDLDRYTPILPSPPRDERRANRLWRSHLNKVLLKAVLQNIRRSIGQKNIYPFLTQVDVSVAPDYHEFVKPEDEMWVHLIVAKLQNLSYSDSSSFRKDFETIQRNCIAYNTPGQGKFGGPDLLGLSAELLEVCCRELEASAQDLKKAEEAIKDPECQPPATSMLAESSGEQNVPTGPSLPLPVGFRHMLRITSSKPAGWVQYQVTCPVHNCLRTADRMGKLVDLLKCHGNCREEWKPYLKHPSESLTAYQDRLRETFNFQKTAPPAQTSRPVAGTSAASDQLPEALPASRADARPAAGGSPPAGQDLKQEQAPSYQDAFKRRDSAMGNPPFPPPTGPVTWPSRSTSPGGTGIHRRLMEVARKRKADEANSEQSDSVLKPSEPSDSRPIKRQALENAPEADRAQEVEQSKAESSAKAAIADARRLLQLEMERYRQEVAGDAPTTADTGLDEDDDLPPNLANGHAEHAEADQEQSEAVDAAGKSELAAVSDSQMVGTSSQPEIVWDGEGFFPRPKEQAYLRYKLSCAEPSSILLLTGPALSGKSCLLEQMQVVWDEEDQKHRATLGGLSKFSGPPWLQFDCRTACSSSSQFAKCLKAAIAEFAHESAAKGAPLPLIRDGDHTGYLKPQDWTPKRGSDEDLGQCFDSLAKWWPELQRPGCRTACLVLDSAHLLREAPWARQVLNALEQFNRQGVHVILAASQSTFRSWLAEAGLGVEVETIGELPQAEAQAYFAGLLKKSAAPIMLERDWKEIWRAVGGNPGLLRRCLQAAASYGSLQPALKSIWQEAGAMVRQGLEPRDRGKAATSTSHTKQQYSAAVGAILDSQYRAVSATELENRLAPNGVRSLRSLAEAGLLMLREPSYLAADIPAEAYGPLQDRLVTLPSAAHAFFWSLLSKASADALSSMC